MCIAHLCVLLLHHVLEVEEDDDLVIHAFGFERLLRNVAQRTIGENPQREQLAERVNSQLRFTLSVLLRHRQHIIDQVQIVNGIVLN